MSRSYKKHNYLGWRCVGRGKTAKRYANRRMRARLNKGLDMANNNDYKKYYPLWYFTDQKYCCFTKKDAINDYYNKYTDYCSYDSYMRWWRTVYYNK